MTSFDALYAWRVLLLRVVEVYNNVCMHERVLIATEMSTSRNVVNNCRQCRVFTVHITADFYEFIHARNKVHVKTKIFS